MIDLTTFLEQRWQEAEADALAAAPGPWNASDLTHVGTIWNAAHIARNDPAHVLADIASKRAILAWFDDYDGAVYDGWTNAAYIVLSELAAPYADHPDYDSDWKP